MSAQLHIIGEQFSVFVRVVQFCCEELGVHYSLGSEYGGVKYSLRSAELKKLNPFGKIPVLIEGDKVLFEAQAICRYLDNQYNASRLQLTDGWQRALVDQWGAAIALYVDKHIVREFLLEFKFPKGENGSVRMNVVNEAMPKIREMVEILEHQLGHNKYIVGDEFSLADIVLTPMLHYLLQVPNNEALVSAESTLRPYLARILARPGAQKVFI